MHWSDEGIVLGSRRHGEANAIIEVMTRAHGRHLGLVRGGAGTRLRPVLQPGNSIRVDWRARLDEHLGHYTVEGLERYPVNLRYPQAYRDSVQALRELPVVTPTGAVVALADLASIDVADGPPMIKSEGARPTAWVFVDIADVDVGTYVKRAQEAIAAETVRIVKVYVETGRVLNVVNLSRQTSATHVLVVRHKDQPGVLATVFDALRDQPVT